MQKRSLTNLALLTIVTLGLYEFVWLAKTRAEMVSKFKAKIPSVGYVALVRFLQLVGFIAVVVIVFHAIPTSNRVGQDALNSRVKPQAQCYGEYNQNAECREEIDNYTAPLPFNGLDWLGVAFAIILASFLMYTLFMRRWAVAYANGVQQVTNQEVPAAVAVGALGGILPLAGMLYVQNAFNQNSVK